MEKDKSPGPDGFNMVFFQTCWPIVKQDLMMVFHEFHYTGRITTNMNSTFIALAPKKDRSIRVKDYRP